MKKTSFFYSIITLTVLFISGCDPSSTPEQIRTTAINCDTPEGILAMMVPPAIQSHEITNVDDVRVTTKLFKTACPTCGATENQCWEKVTMRVFYSSERSRLVSLPEFASNGNWDELYARGHREKAFSSAGSATNEKSLTLTPNFQNSSQTYYRIAKEIEQGNAEAGLNPFVWSEIFVYNRGNPPPPPSACTQPDLQPAPEDDDITVFSDLSGSLSDSTGNTYIKTARVWCSGFFDGSGQLLPGNVSGNDSNLGEIRQLLITLPPITWGVTETNNVNINTAFNCSLFRRGESNAIATFNVPSLAAGDTFNGPPFTDRGTRIVFLFPSQGLDACFVKTFDHVQGNLDVKEREYEVRVDTGSAVAECSESNNRKTYKNNGSATFISP